MLLFLCIQNLLIGIAFACNGQPSNWYRPDHRPAGGYPATIEEAPYQIQIQLQNIYEHWVVLCGGAILKKDIILSTGACLYAPKNVTRVLSGSAQYRNGTIHAIDRIIIHENITLEFGSSDYDIAIARVTPPFKFDKTMRAIKIVKEEPNSGELGLVTGWGSAYNFKDNHSELLRKINVTIVDREKCREAYDGDILFSVTNNTICGKPPNLRSNYQDACVGELGAPLIVRGKLVGLNLLSHRCDKEKLPAIYTDVVKFSSWIEEKIAILSK